MSIGTVGNLIIIIYFGFKCKEKSSYKLFITLLGVTDVIACIIAIAFVMLRVVLDKWIFGDIVCLYIFPTFNMCVLTSIIMLIGMAYERYRGIVKPFKKKIEKKHV